MELFYTGLAASLIAGLATGAGALPVIFVKSVSDNLLDVLLGFAAGVMLAATAFSLLVPAIELGGPLISAIGLGAGALIIHLVDQFTPHFHPVAGAEGPSSRLSRVWLLMIAITIHNFPEGLAVGVSFGTGNIASGLIVATAIGLQNMPEAVKRFKNKIKGADALLIATPEYNSSIPGVLKNALDWASRPYGDNSLDGKPVAIMSASIGMLGGARAQTHLRQILTSLNAYVVNRPEVIVNFANEKFDADGNLRDERAKAYIRQLLENLARLAEMLKANVKS